MEAIEIDNERLKADLKYNKDRLGNLQDQVYELKQELESEIEKKERIEEEMRNTIVRHKSMMKKMKEENVNQAKENESLEMKLGQVEMRLKECVETMEKDRIELEGLRDELIVSQPRRSNQTTKLVIPTNTDDDDFSKKIRFGRTEEETVRDQQDEDEDDYGDRTGTVMDKGEIPYHPTGLDPSNKKSQVPIHQKVQTVTQTKEELEIELRQAKRRIESLLEELGEKHQEQTPRLETQRSNENFKTRREEEERLRNMKHDPSLLCIKQDESLGLIQRLDNLEKHLTSFSSQSTSPHHQPQHHQDPTHLKGRWRKRGGKEEGEGSFGSSVGSSLPIWVTDPRSQASNASVTGSLSKSNRIGNMTKEMQEILGLKVLLNQSDDDRVKVEIENRELKQEIEELKNTNRMLEGAIENPMKVLKDYDKTVRLEKEIRELRREIENLNRKHIQQVDALNQEVVELESIIEVKVLKEAEIEAELQHYKYNT
ncbi:uncharacterized protein MELLADRAFT_85806 [Melampsora larici-populina 98AG31]|uniref:Uncharacterized protein n=1 Tax=Melampsora larici-populina (strain 98AG31 / pathotype 3-4-7) TaxID=747676 RepID=F4RJU8_MELLP|nr:uncharacterized protein MELLADRAFT_85806 [Melampsora larici-populina 98AG31]EGG07435.1 hypothetical protein MELLADRAFT_85806 [Melampsora larici-populina 98AG31]